MNKRRRFSLSVKDKLKVIVDVENGVNVNEICKTYRIHKSTITKIKQNKQNIERFISESNVNPNKFKRLRHAKYVELEKALYVWFLKQRTNKVIVTNESIKMKAKEIYRNMGLEGNFLISDGWITNFKKRFGIRLLAISGEKLSCDHKMVPKFLETFKNIIAENNYLPEQIYNCDETGLIYKGLSKKTNAAKYEKTASGGKPCKERVTVMPCANSTGNHKLQLMLIGKSKKPRSFKNINVPLYYRSSRNAWQTTCLFKEWFHNEFIPQVTDHLKSQGLPVKALLILDNATCHGTENLFIANENFKILYFPPNMTPLLQPLDQHVIRSLKQRYRKHLLMTLGIAENYDEMMVLLKNFTLKDVCYLIIEAWKEVPKEVITNSFKHLFASNDDLDLNLSVHHVAEEDEIPISRLYQTIISDNSLSDKDIMDWASGENENNLCFCAENIILDKAEVKDADEDYETVDITNIKNVISSLTVSLEWAELNNLSVNEILLLRRMRKKAVEQKYDFVFKNM